MTRKSFLVYAIPTPLLLTLVLLFGDYGGIEALVSTISAINPKISVSPVQSAKDIVDLGNLRYSEWMLDLDPQDRPSRMAFRMATAECQQERMEQNAIAFLARSSSNEAPGGEVVGTAELSCIELKDCYYDDDSPESISHFFYVTDVVTARTHRRQGVAATLMDALEQHALRSSSSGDGDGGEGRLPVLLLHVEHDNTAALAFYQALGYQIVDGHHELEGLNIDRLSENAGVSGQLLLSKTLEKIQAAGPITTAAVAAANKKSKKKKARNNSGGGFGFGK